MYVRKGKTGEKQRTAFGPNLHRAVIYNIEYMIMLRFPISANWYKIMAKSFSIDKWEFPINR